MGKPRDPNKYSAEELLAILNETPEDQGKKTDVYQYIQDCEMKEGDKFLPNSVIFYFYNKNPSYKKYKRRAFFQIFGLYFKSVSLPYQRGYYLDWNQVVTEEDLNQALILTRKESYEKVKQKRHRKRKKKEATSENSQNEREEIQSSTQETKDPQDIKS